MTSSTTSRAVRFPFSPSINRLEVRIKNAYEDVKTEIAIMKKLNHPNLIKLYEVIDDHRAEQLYMGIS